MIDGLYGSSGADLGRYEMVLLLRADRPGWRLCWAFWVVSSTVVSRLAILTVNERQGSNLYGVLNRSVASHGFPFSPDAGRHC